MFDTFLSKLEFLREVLTNPAIPDAVDKVANFADYVAEQARIVADSIRSLQSGVAFSVAPLTEEELAAVAKCESLLQECHSLASAERLTSGSPQSLAVDPATLILLLQLAGQLLDWLKKRRNG